ncbi:MULTISPECIES: hypothetical protein [Clostridium]|uniref:Uncharacterized protein n=1 Tax=Clostridium lapidicellarium TaxID=3240931 RepID=A0ABV4DV18_9CLOT
MNNHENDKRHSTRFLAWSGGLCYERAYLDLYKSNPGTPFLCMGNW